MTPKIINPASLNKDKKQMSKQPCKLEALTFAAGEFWPVSKVRLRRLLWLAQGHIVRGSQDQPAIEQNSKQAEDFYF